MMPKTIRFRILIPMAAILLAPGTAAWCGAAERVALDGAAIVADPDPPSFVRHAIDDLAGYLLQTTGSEVPILQLRLRAARERLANVSATPSKSECVGLVRDYLDAYLAWDTAHGWHELWGWQAWPLGDFAADPRFPVLAGRIRKCWGDEAAVDERFEEIARGLSARYDARTVQEGGIAPLRKAVRAAAIVVSLAQKARATASVVPDPVRYPPGAANDGSLATLYWPGALVQDNAEWLQLTWDEPLAFERVIVRFLQHPSMTGRTIRLQGEVRPGVWEDIATAAIPADPAAPHAVATFRLPSRRTLDKIRIVNLLDLFEIEVY